MKHKYVRFENYGFILWPYSDIIAHSQIGRCNCHGKVLSAGFVNFNHGVPHCYGRSESIGIGGLPDDEEVLKAQLGF